MKTQMARVQKSRLIVPQLVGSNGENPRVSGVSSFHDDVWEFINEDGNPARSSGEKKIRWSFRTPDGGLFTVCHSSVCWQHSSSSSMPFVGILSTQHRSLRVRCAPCSRARSDS